MLNEAVNLIREFQKKANQSFAYYPCKMSKEQVIKRIKWITEELDELKTAQNEYEQADALIDAVYYLLGAFVDMGINPDNLFNIIHNSNMKKVESESHIKKDSENKILKPEGWIHPNEEIKIEINNQKKHR